MRAAALIALAFAVSVAACGKSEAPASKDEDTYSTHGVSVQLPPGWQAANESLTPDLGDPRQALAVGTYPLRYRRTGCAHVPGSALEDMGPGDAFVELEERGRARGPSYDFPPRPERFGPSLGAPSEAAECVPKARFEDHWFGISDGDRRFHVRVAFGPEATAAVKNEAWGILDSLRVDPDTKPDWRATT
jgi:hypothetical protein